MSRLSRKLAPIAVLAIIVLNLWFMSTLFTNNKSSALSGTPPKSDPANVNEGHHAGSSWNSKPGAEHQQSQQQQQQQQQQQPQQQQHQQQQPHKDPVEENKGNIGGSKPPPPTDGYDKAYDQGMKVIKKVLDTIAEIKPGVEPLSTYNRDIKTDTSLHESGDLPPTSTVLGMYLQIADADVEKLKRSHAEMMKKLPDSVAPGAFRGRGIVMTGGGMYFPMVLTAIKWVREMDKTTPIEVFMADSSEYEAHICDGLFPKLNVACRVVRDIYGAQLADKLDSKYALKPLAILASRFDDIYFMDADSYPLMSLDRVFDWSVYEETGLILNADYWPRYISPRFYEIVGIKLGGRARGDPNSAVLLQSDRENAVPGSSTESGQIFVRKSAHLKSLLLAMYYNLYGPSYYFPLLMQGGHGEGDKDTYAAAAIVCGETYYQTQRRPVTLGQHLENGGYKGYAMSQPDPIADYERLQNHRDDVPEVFFALHANSIKSNPKHLLTGYEESMRGAPPLRQQRFFGDMGNVRHELLSDADVEARLFRTMAEVACEWGVHDNYIPRDWDDADPQRLCKILKAHTKWLSEHPDVDAPADAAFWIDLEGV